MYADFFLESNYTQGSELPQLNQSRNQAKCHSLTFFHQNRLLYPKVLLSGYNNFCYLYKILTKSMTEITHVRVQ